MIFECYQIPSLLTGIDALFSNYYNQPDINNCVITSLGHHTCHILPVVDGKMKSDLAARINLGGFNLTLYLQRLLQLKYPKHTSEFTFTKCEHIVQTYTKFSSDYDSDGKLWADEKYSDKFALNLKVKKENAPTGQNPAVSQQAPSENFALTCNRLLNKVETNLLKKQEKTVSIKISFLFSKTCIINLLSCS